jgi:hypothetical protein
MKASLRLLAASVLIPLISFGPVLSQSSTGSISGTVTDQNNALVQGAKVFGRNTATGFPRPAVTNSSGLYPPICRQIEERCGMNGNIVRKLEQKAIRFPTVSTAKLPTSLPFIPHPQTSPR